MEQEFRPVIESFARLGLLVDYATANPDAYAESIERWQTTTLFFLDVSRRHAHDPDEQAKVLKTPRHPAPAAFHTLMNDLLLRAEKEHRIIYVPDTGVKNFDGLFDVLRRNGWGIAPPEDTGIMLVMLSETFEWSHENARRALMTAGRFVML